ncbi:hypothetical protein ACHAWF_012185 [Thalassiosira exigua]
MRCRSALRAVGSSPLLVSFLIAAFCRHDGSVMALSFARSTRQRRFANNGESSSPSSLAPSSSPSTSTQEQLIRDEEAARVHRLGQAKRRREKHARIEDRISHLESLACGATDAQRKELDGLLRRRDSFEEQYDPTAFTEEHAEFKRIHNSAFVALARFCQRDRAENVDGDGSADGGGSYGDGGGAAVEDPNVFYLDGPDGATSIALENDGFEPSCCYVANRHLQTCELLRGRLPEENVAHCTAAEALTPRPDAIARGEAHIDRSPENDSFAAVDFSAYYFDGCGGYVPHVVGMMSAALIRGASLPYADQKTTAVGFSLMGGNRDVVQKEMEVCQALAMIARTRGMRIRHVLDDPGRYRIPMEISKTEGGTFTSWVLLEKDS